MNNELAKKEIEEASLKAPSTGEKFDLDNLFSFDIGPQDMGITEENVSKFITGIKKELKQLEEICKLLANEGERTKCHGLSEMVKSHLEALEKSDTDLGLKKEMMDIITGLGLEAKIEQFQAMSQSSSETVEPTSDVLKEEIEKLEKEIGKEEPKKPEGGSESDKSEEPKETEPKKPEGSEDEDEDESEKTEGSEDEDEDESEETEPEKEKEKEKEPENIPKTSTDPYFNAHIEMKKELDRIEKEPEPEKEKEKKPKKGKKKEKEKAKKEKQEAEKAKKEEEEAEKAKKEEEEAEKAEMEKLLSTSAGPYFQVIYDMKKWKKEKEKLEEEEEDKKKKKDLEKKEKGKEKGKGKKKVIIEKTKEEKRQERIERIKEQLPEMIASIVNKPIVKKRLGSNIKSYTPKIVALRIARLLVYSSW